MPYQRKCEHSGAIIFHLTEDEESVQTLKSELESMKAEMSSKLKELSLVLKQAKGGEKK